MKREIKILDFLRTGIFGTVEINDSVETVIGKLGKPDGKINVSNPQQGIHYSMYEFMFFENKLESIQNDHFDPEFPELMEFKNETFDLNSAFLKADQMKTISDIEIELKKLNIEYKIIDYWGRKAIKTIGNVVIDFDDEKGFELIGIRYYPTIED